MLNESGISVVPPPRSRLASSNSSPAPPAQHTHQTRQCWPDQPVSTHTNQLNKKEVDSESSENDKNTHTSKSEDDKSTHSSESHMNTSSTDGDNEHQADDERNLNEGNSKNDMGGPNACMFLFLII